ncbi:MAG: hypothetical protein GXP35_07290 [Actinobacteria bacterium]|nr:hypothetical protein [Actinomycetota bacterium]
MRIDANEAGLAVTTDGASAVLEWSWIADHCDDVGSVDADTRQRRRNTYGNEVVARPELAQGDQQIDFVWADGTESSISMDLLASVLPTRHVGVPRPLVAGLGLDNDITLWHTGDQAAPPSFVASEIVGDEAVRQQFVNAIWRWGVVTIEQCEAGRAQVESLAGAIGYVRRTIFGGVWELAAEVTDHRDSAYTKVHLGMHTDGTYMHDAPGLQLFVCQERDGTGGESVIADGFAAAARLADDDPEGAALLAGVSVPGHYVEPGVDLRAERPVIATDSAGRITQFSLNNYDRSPFYLGPADRPFRAAYSAISADIEQAQCWHRISWKPGRAMIINNWRVLHGRTAFTGSRRFLGAYLNHEDLESVRRVFANG